MKTLKVYRTRRLVFLTDQDGKELYSQDFPTVSAAKRLADQLAQEVVAGLRARDLCVAADLVTHG